VSLFTAIAVQMSGNTKPGLKAASLERGHWDHAPSSMEPIVISEVEATSRPLGCFMEEKSPKKCTKAWIKDCLHTWFHSGFGAGAIETNLMQEVLQI